MYYTKGKLRKTEYYKFDLWKSRRHFWFVPLAALFYVAISTDLPLTNAELMREYRWEILNTFLLEFIFYLVFGFILLLILYLLIATIEKRDSLQMREYVFDEKQITIRTSNSEGYISWNEVQNLRETSDSLLIELRNKRYIYIPTRFFEDETQAKTTISFIRRKIKE